MRIYNNMPVMREKLWPQVKENLAVGLDQGVDLTWQPILFDDEWGQLSEGTKKLLNEAWIDVLVTARDPNQFAMTQKNNFGLQVLEERGKPPGFLFWGSDDNLLPHNIWKQWRSATSRDPAPWVIVCSCKRGQNTGASGYDTSDLIAAPENLAIGKITGEQVIVRTELMRGRRLAQHREQDGALVEELLREIGLDRFHFLRDTWIPFNSLEEGRWDPEQLRQLLQA